MVSGSLISTYTQAHSNTNMCFGFHLMLRGSLFFHQYYYYYYYQFIATFLQLKVDLCLSTCVPSANQSKVTK